MSVNVISPQYYPGSTYLLILKQHSNQPIRFEGQVYSFCHV